MLLDVTTEEAKALTESLLLAMQKNPLAQLALELLKKLKKQIEEEDQIKDQKENKCKCG